MEILDAFQQVGNQVVETPLIEWIAVVFGVIQVLLARNNNVWLYPAGIISTALSIYILAKVDLFAESFLNVYYLVMSIYGWLHWIRNRNEPELYITKANKNDWTITIAIVLIGWTLLYYILKNYTTSDVPLMDAWVSATAWAGMWLLAKRKLENWILLNISNLFAIPLQVYKHIPLYAILTLVLFVVAIFGYLKWRNIYRLQQQTVAVEH